MGIIFALFFGAAVVFIFILAVIITLIEIVGSLLGSAFSFLMQVGMYSLILIVGIIGAVIIWKLLKRAFKEIKEVRAYLKKIKEIENLQKERAMRE